MRLLVTGASGQLGSYLLRECQSQSISVIGWSCRRSGELFGCTLRPVDLLDTGALATAFHDARPDVVLHTAALTAVSECQRQPERARLINTGGSQALAQLANNAGIPMIHVSTDMVFDGEKAPYREDDRVAPLSIYGRTKAEAEQAVLAFPRHAVVRVPLLFGPTLIGRPTFFDQQLSALRQGQRVTLFCDEWRTPLDLLTTARGLLTLVESPPAGLLHMGGPERMSRLEMGLKLARSLACDPACLVSISRTQAPAAEPRPRDLSLDSSRWRHLYPHSEWPAWDEALAQLLSS